jgi:hypothetical protein
MVPVQVGRAVVVLRLEHVVLPCVVGRRVHLMVAIKLQLKPLAVMLIVPGLIQGLYATPIVGRPKFVLAPNVMVFVQVLPHRGDVIKVLGLILEPHVATIPVTLAENIRSVLHVIVQVAPAMWPVALRISILRRHRERCMLVIKLMQRVAYLARAVPVHLITVIQQENMTVSTNVVVHQEQHLLEIVVVVLRCVGKGDSALLSQELTPTSLNSFNEN